MTEEVRARLFEPYFTTREQGEGTGLGLATVHGIVHDHQGAIQVHSAPGKGATFEVLFPICSEVGPKPQKRPAEGALPRGAERVLLVDDEEAIVGFLERSLARLGYSVKAFTSSNKAYKEFKAAPRAFDIVITDHTMPKLTGFNLAQRLLAIRPELPIILCTGNSETVDEKKPRRRGLRSFT